MFKLNHLILSSYLAILSLASYAQKLPCGCKAVSSTYTIEDCKVIHLKNGYTLYYQVNCDSVWLTLKNANGNKKVIYSMSGEDFKEYGNFNYRLGYQFAHEYRKYLLFRTGCPANGPCNFILVNKFTGRKHEELGELIYDHSTRKFYDFVIYRYSKGIVLYYPDRNKEHYYRIKNMVLNDMVPEYQIDILQVNDHSITLKYPELKGEKTLVIDIRK